MRLSFLENQRFRFISVRSRGRGWPPPCEYQEGTPNCAFEDCGQCHIAMVQHYRLPCAVEEGSNFTPFMAFLS